MSGLNPRAKGYLVRVGMKMNPARWLTASSLTVAVWFKKHARRKGGEPAPGSGPTHDDNRDEALVDEWGVESFPASDPRQSW